MNNRCMGNLFHRKYSLVDFMDVNSFYGNYLNIDGAGYFISMGGFGIFKTECGSLLCYVGAYKKRHACRYFS